MKRFEGERKLVKRYLVEKDKLIPIDNFWLDDGVSLEIEEEPELETVKVEEITLTAEEMEKLNIPKHLLQGGLKVGHRKEKH